MTTEHLEIDAHVIRQLGDQLITDAEQALLELLKNSYDADARRVKVTIDLDTKTEYGLGSITVEDNGNGMDFETVRAGWLRVSFSLKRPPLGSSKVKTREQQRTPLGDKGLGRLGTMRLGRVVRIETFSKEKEPGYKVILDWDAFRPGIAVSGIDIPVLDVPYDLQSAKGTRITVLGLSDPDYWRGKERRDELRRRFSQLVSPFRTVKNFRIVLVVEGNKVELDELQDDIRDTATSRYYANWNGKSLTCRAEMKLSLFRSDQNADDFAPYVERDKGARLLAFLQALPSGRDFSITGSDRAGWYLAANRTVDYASVALKFAGEQASDPGPLVAEIDSFELGTATKAIKKIFADFDDYKQYVKDHQGVRVYRDGFEVRMPDDWVGLGKTWTSGKSYYGLRPSNTLGFVAVTAEHNNSLTEKSDREGFVDSPSSRMFRAIVESFVEFCNQLLHVVRRGTGAFLKDRKSEKANLQPQWAPKDAVKQLEEMAASSRAKKAAMERADSARRAKARDVRVAVKKVISASEVPASLRKQAQSALEEADKAIQEWEKTREELAELYKTADHQRALADAILERFEHMQAQTEEVYETVGIGLMAQAIAHDMNSMLEDLSARTTKLLRDAGSKVPPYLIGYTESVRATVSLLRKQTAFLEPMLRRGRENRQQFTVSGFVEEFAELRKERFAAQNAKLLLRVTGNFSVRMNRGRLLQILENLVRNSEYWLLSSKTKKPECVISVDSPILAIEDNGPGVRPSIEDAIFEMFISDKPNRDGSGLGLFICRQLLEAENCSIVLDDERNAQGRRYRFLVNLQGVVFDK